MKDFLTISKLWKKSIRLNELFRSLVQKLTFQQLIDLNKLKKRLYFDDDVPFFVKSCLSVFGKGQSCL